MSTTDGKGVRNQRLTLTINPGRSIGTNERRSVHSAHRVTSAEQENKMTPEALQTLGGLTEPQEVQT